MKNLNQSYYSSPVIKKDQPDDTYKFQPLPEPTGRYPYRLKLPDNGTGMSTDKLVFHLVGDTGSLRSPDFQRQVATAMGRQYEVAPADQPRFLYHLGDVVYNFGEKENYYSQFFKPYQYYPGPVYAIAGNHDSDVNPASPLPYKSLDSFTSVFCDSHSQNIIFSREAQRKSNTQPNVYWTLETPLATIIGLHSNVPKYGIITDEQRQWFIEEIKAADQERPGKALLVCVHHAPYSADTNHSSSLFMIRFLENVFKETGIRPDMVFSGHVHNYQRFTKQYPDGGKVRFIVAGAGGYDELHAIAQIGDEHYSGENELFKGVNLEHYEDDCHGFLKMTIERKAAGLTLTGEYYTIPHKEELTEVLPATMSDHFTIVI